MRDALCDPSQYALGEAREDPRGLWSFDALGVVDLREANSALALFRKHVEEASQHAL